ncbi:MAG: ABC transporter permease [Chloroflexi bacterium]|nr:ABC transporter permease [Chloroflexota bacterium]
MFRSLFSKTLWDERWAVAGFGLGLAVLAAMMVAIYPSVAAGPQFGQLIESYPSAIRSMFVGSIKDFNSLAGFLNLEFFNLMYPMILAIFIVLLASGFVAGEEDNGTMDLLLSVPIPRWRVVAEKYAASTMGIAVIGLLTVIGLEVGAVLVGVSLGLGQAVAGSFGVMPLILAISGYCTLFSCVIRHRKTAALAAAGLTLVFYFANALAPLVKELETVRQISVFYYVDSYENLTSGVNWANAGLLLGFAAILIAASITAFQRRDIAV